MRIFIGISFNNNVLKYLKQSQELLLLNLKDSLKTPINNFHLTLVFIGELDLPSLNTVISKLNKKTYNISNFTIHLSNPNTFKNTKNHILYMDVTDKENNLARLSKAIKDILNFNHISYDKKPLKPHITLAKLTNASAINNPPLLPTYKPPILIDSFTIFRSDRINGLLTYTPIKKIEFNKEKSND